jgi:predicted RNA-binding Zn-ribbon protein involved in translation (DUF1610 family)
VEAIVDILGDWIDYEWGLDDNDWLGECKAFCWDIENQMLEDFRPCKPPTHQIFSAIEYLWRAGLKEGEAPLLPLLKAQERLTPYPEFGEGTIVGRILANAIITVSARTQSIVCPNCGAIELGTIYPDTPFENYHHECGKCGHIIMESEWELAE